MSKGDIRATTKRLSPAGSRVLQLAVAGQPLDTGLRGRSQYGGWHGTLFALRRRGLLDQDNRITEAGKAEARKLQAAIR